MSLYQIIRKNILYPVRTILSRSSQAQSVISRSSSTDLKAVLAKKIPKEQARVRAFVKQAGSKKLGDITVAAIYGGMRGMLGLVWDISLLDPGSGIRFRNHTLFDCLKILPKASGSTQPLPEALFWLFLTGDVPNQEQANAVTQEWNTRSEVPDHVLDFLYRVPTKVHPMSQLSSALTLMGSESKFVKAYNDGVHKLKYWEYVYEDTMDVLAKITTVAAVIYRHTFKGDKVTQKPDSGKDWSANFCRMLGFDTPEFFEVMRLYMIIHSDHEGGNVSAHTTHLVGSALSDPYLSLASGINGLAGPLHGLANQEVLLWIMEMSKALGENPDDEKIKGFIWKTLKSGRVVPGFGHAVLRVTDPRYVVLKEFSEKHFPDDRLLKLVSKLYKLVPPILKELGKVKNPWPNIDADSGVVLQYYGLKEMKYYTVLFSVSRAMGVLAQLVWSRALGLPIERPKSITTDALMKKVK